MKTFYINSNLDYFYRHNINLNEYREKLYQRLQDRFKKNLIDEECMPNNVNDITDHNVFVTYKKEFKEIFVKAVEKTVKILNDKGLVWKYNNAMFDWNHGNLHKKGKTPDFGTPVLVKYITTKNKRKEVVL